MRMTNVRAGARIAMVVGLASRSVLAQTATATVTASPAEVGAQATATTPGAKDPTATAPEGKQPHALVELGLFGGAFFPSKDHSLVGSGKTQQPFDSPAPEVGVRAAFLPLAYGGVEAEAAVMPAKTESGESGGFSAVRGHLLGQLPLEHLTPFAVLGLGRLAGTSTNTGTGTDLAFHFGVGAKVALDDFVSARLDLRDTLSDKLGGSGQTHNPEVLVGLSFLLGPAKEAPAAPPAQVADADGDGKADAEDQCPTEAATTPDGCPARDTDGDTVLDAKDACPAEAGSAPCGCPPRDQDGDKVIDELDACPTVAGPIAGCPDPDADHDGVRTPADQCPDKAETPNGFQDGDGCPDEVPEKVKKFTGVIQGIEFDRGKDTIRPVSATALDAAVSVLAEFPALRLMITGHTDADGDRAVNVDLSKRRAEAVKAYFTGKGVAAARIETAGAGPDQPIADNKTAAGKQKNRRIEFKLLGEGAAPPPAQ